MHSLLISLRHFISLQIGTDNFLLDIESGKTKNSFIVYNRFVALRNWIIYILISSHVHKYDNTVVDLDFHMLMDLFDIPYVTALDRILILSYW